MKTKVKAINGTIRLTTEIYTTLEDAYNFFNDMLFENKLPCVVIVLHRKKNTNGYFHGDRFVERSSIKTSKKKLNTVSELSLNPDTFIYRTDEQILSTLLHEMVHVWQHVYGEKKSKNGYHNKEWGNKMKEVGLYPSSTGKPEGKETGQKVSHYIIKDGKFELHVKQLLKSTKLNWSSFPILPKVAEKKEKTKYVCPGCNAKVWGKPGMNIECSDCEERFETE